MADLTVERETLGSSHEVHLAKAERKVSWRANSATLLATVYGALLLAGISVWFLAIRAPLWTDETLSYWQIAGGFKQIWARSVQGNSFAAYAYILWLTNVLFGSNEIILRIPSIIAMLAAVYLFYRCARELFPWDVSLIAAAMFVALRNIAFAAIDVRPYAFALLLTNLTIFLFLRWMKTGETRYAAYFGISSAGIFYFHYLFATILGALAICYFVLRQRSERSNLRQIGAAAGCFAVFILPVLPRLHYIYQTRAEHSFARAPHMTDLRDTLYLGHWPLLILACALLLAALTRTLVTPSQEALEKFAVCATLALFPAGFLYLVSVNTSIHIFIPRYLMVVVPGYVLSWVWFSSLIDSRAIRALLCCGLVGLAVVQAYRSPLARWHEDSWKEALAVADKEAARDGAWLAMCSPLVEADYQPMPDVPEQSVLYSPLSYYKVSAPVFPLPRLFNQEAARQVNRLLAQLGPQHKRFLALVPWPSVRTLDYLADSARGIYTPRVLGQFDFIWVVEFDPVADAD